MKKKILSITLALVLIAAFLMPALPAVAGPPEWAPRGKPEKLEPGERRLAPHVKTHVLRNFTGPQGKKFQEVEAIISSLPTTLNDGKTLIDTNWYLLSDRSGQTYFQTGVNTFTARVLEGRVSVEDANGRLIVWNPTVSIGGKKFSGGTAKITNDPINENYEGNVLKWEYGSYSDGWWIFALNSAQIERYLRVIEDYIAESWVLPIDPKASVYIDLNETAEANYGRRIDWLIAFDADGHPLEVTKNKAGIYVISASEFSGKTFPVTIDPTSPRDYGYNDSYDSGEIFNAEPSYSATRTASYGSVRSSSYGTIGQYYAPGYNYSIDRFATMFNTSDLNISGLVIDAAALYLYGYSDGSDTDFWITIRNGMPTYPHKPVISSDYYYLNYSGDGGQLSTVGWSTYAYNVITLNAAGRSWINKTGWTKFMLQSNRDIDGVAPSEWVYEDVAIRTYQAGASLCPELRVVFHIPVVAPQVTTQTQTGVTETQATFKGYLNSDGNEACSVRFQYQVMGRGIIETTAWVGGYTTGLSFETPVPGLDPGRAADFNAQAANSHSTVSGSTLKFITYPYVPTNFTATGEENQIALTWTKGGGAQKTMVRRAEGSYPTTPTSGTQIYFDTDSSHDDTTAVVGTTYYYSAWSYATESSLEAYSQVKATDYAEAYTLGAPSVTTNDATAVEATTATLNLYLNDLGGYATTNVWFQYGLTEGYGSTTTSTQKSAPGTHSAGIASLDTGTTYHFRAVAQNTHSTVYGSDKSFQTGITTPTVTTNAATIIGYETATLNLVLTDDGGENCEVSFEYGLTTGYGTPTDWIAGYSSTDTYALPIIGLDSDETYHFRARARNAAGTVYGSDAQFDTLAAPPDAPTAQTNAATDIEYSTVTLHGQVISDGGEACQVRFNWGLTTGYGTNTEWQYGKVTGNNFSWPLINLDPEETYHFRAEVKNSTASGYGADAQFDTTAVPPETPTVGTNAATDVGSSTATLHGTLTADGGEACQVRFQYGLTAAYGDYTDWQDGKVSSNTFQQAIVNLDPDTTYHFQAIAKNSAGTSYGGDETFKTIVLPPCAPTMTTQTATGIQLTSVTLNGVVTDYGRALVTAWFEYGLTTEYEMGSSPTTSPDLGTSDPFYYNLGNLEPATTYHYRAVGQNSAGIGYGIDVEFETATPTAPTLNTDAATEVGANEATLRGTLTSDGGVSCEVQFQWGLTTGYGTDTGWQPGFTTGMDFAKLISDLTVGETYHFRAQAKNLGGTTSGSDAQFTTKFTPPTDFAAKAISSTTATLTWTKAGDQTYIRYKQTGFPIDRDDGLPVYFGPDEIASVSGLLAGTTYYFKAWSWREGDVWAVGYAEDVATTSPTVAGVTEERPESVTLPEEPSTWFQVPSGAALTKMPFYDVAVEFAESYEMPEESFWVSMAVLLTIIAGIVGFALGGGGFGAVIAGSFTGAGCAALGMTPLWFIYIYIVIAGGFVFIKVNRGAI